MNKGFERGDFCNPVSAGLFGEWVIICGTDGKIW